MKIMLKPNRNNCITCKNEKCLGCINITPKKFSSKSNAETKLSVPTPELMNKRRFLMQILMVPLIVSLLAGIGAGLFFRFVLPDATYDKLYEIVAIMRHNVNIYETHELLDASPFTNSEHLELDEIITLAEDNNIYAQFVLGMRYYWGEQAPQDYELAAVWLRRAAEQGDVLAQTFIGSMYGAG